jgi:hypothetical protein
MPKINTAASGHTGPTPLPGGFTYDHYTDEKFIKTLKRAMHIIELRIRGHNPCNEAFRALPGGRSFADVWDDANVWINFDPSRKGGRYGATRGNDVTITAYSLAMGHWTVAATLVHELAHVNGAPGTTHAAEGTLRSCLLGGLEDPNIIGAVSRASDVRVA